MSEDSFVDQIWKSSVVLMLGAILGLVLLVGGVAFLVWSEGKAVHTAQSLEQGEALAVTVPADHVSPANNGKLVHVTGEATTNDTLTDPDFGIAVKELRLAREVEVFQWKETKNEKKKDDKTVVTYSYSQDWSKDKPAQHFAEPAGHKNPPDKPYADATLNAKEVKLGAFSLTPAQVERIPAREDLAVTKDMLTKLPDDLKGRAEAAEDGTLFVAAKPGSTPDDPQVGDARIRYKAAKPQTVTVVAKQSGDTFEPYPAEGGEMVDLLEPGAHTAQDMFASAQTSNAYFYWLMRAVGLVLIAVAIALVIRRQIASARGTVPEGTAASLGILVFAALVALPVVLFVAGLRWVSYQPPLGGALLAGGPVLLILVLLVTRLVGRGFLGSVFGKSKKWSPQERDLFRRIALDPENAELRRELAALLEKKGDPMGEFIRITQEIHELPKGDQAREVRDRRWGELLQTHGETWFAPLRKLGLEPKLAGRFYPGLWVHNGIIDTVRVDRPGVLPERADQLFEAAPGLRVLEFHNIRLDPALGGWKEARYEADIPAIVRLPLLKQVRALRLSSQQKKLEDLKAIASSPNLVNLTELDFGFNRVGSEGAVLLALSTTLTHLRVLDLRSCDIGEEGAVALARSPNLAGLVKLDLGHNQIGRGGAAALASSAHLKNLRELSLDDNQIGPIGAQAVAGSPHWRHLTRLDLSENEIGSEGAQALAKSANLAALRELKLNKDQLGGAGLRLLAGSPHLGQLRVLELQSNEIDDQGVIALVGSKVMTRLEEVKLSLNNIGDAGFEALAKWPGLARLKKLVLSWNKAGAAGIKALAASPYVRGLESLDLSHNNVGEEGAEALAGSPGLKDLENLWLYEANITPKGESLLRKRFNRHVVFK